MRAASHPGQRGFPGVLFQAPLLLPQAALTSEGGTDPVSHHPAPWESSKARARQCSLLDLALTCPFLSIPCRMTSAKHLLSVSKLTALTAELKHKTKLDEKRFFSWSRWQRREQAEVDPLHLVLSCSVPKQ